MFRAMGGRMGWKRHREVELSFTGPDSSAGNVRWSTVGCDKKRHVMTGLGTILRAVSPERCRLVIGSGRLWRRPLVVGPGLWSIRCKGCASVGGGCEVRHGFGLGAGAAPIPTFPRKQGKGQTERGRPVPRRRQCGGLRVQAVKKR